jgi:hypothetical protein
MSELIPQHNMSTLNLKLLLSIDPGKQTGIAIGHYGDNEPYTLIKVWQISDGVTGFIEWWNKTGKQWKNDATIVSEKFVLRGSNKFVADLEPVKIEGAMQALGIKPVWQLRTDKMFVTDELLKEHNLWQTGKQFGWKDGRDANDAIVHALAYLRKGKHLETLKQYWSKEI